MENLNQEHGGDKEQPRKVFKGDDLEEENSINNGTDLETQISNPADDYEGKAAGLIVRALEAASTSEMLPEEILRIIFKCIWDSVSYDDYDKEDEDSEGTIESVLKCRLVCSTWKNAVDNFGYFMDNICCVVDNIPEFINSTIATKVKALCFNHYELTEKEGEVAEEDQLDIFYNQIVPNIQMFDFDFLPSSEKNGENDKDFETKGQQNLFTNLIKSAKDLQEIRISSPNRQFLRPLNMDEIELVGSKIKEFHLNVSDLDRSEMAVLREFLFSMPNLCKLVLFHLDKDGNDNRHDHEMLCFLTKQVIIPHIRVFPGSLKEVSFDIDLDKLNEELPILNALTFTAMQYGLEINFANEMVDLGNVFNDCKKLQVDVNEFNCGSIKNGRIHLNWSNPEVNHYFSLETAQKIRFCTKLEQLQLLFGKAISDTNELEFLPKLKNLWSLMLCERTKPELARFNSPDLVFLPNGIPSLRSLIIEGSIFNSYTNFSKYFPNLVKLWLENIGNAIPVDFLFLLSKMEKLTDLGFYECQVTDQMFTQPCEVVADGGGHIPAIAAFKSLKSITIFGCNLLTDACLIGGVSHSVTLESLTLISGCGGGDGRFSDIGFNAVKNSGRIKLIQQ